MAGDNGDRLFAVFSASAAAWTLLLTGFLAWQLLLSASELWLDCLRGAKRRVWQITRRMNWMLNFGVAGAVCNLIRRSNWKDFASAVAYDLSVALLVASTVLLLKVLLTTPRLRANLPALFSRCQGGVLPANTGFYQSARGLLVVRNRSRCSVPYFYDHCLQQFQARYCGAVSLRARLRRDARSIRTPGRWGAGFAAYTGLVMSHFLIDAKIWWLRQPLQRELIQQRFGFIFNSHSYI